MFPSNELANLKRRVSRAERQPRNTDPSSRHVHAMALALSRGEKYHMLDEEPEHCAGSLLAVLESLYKARNELAMLRPTRPSRATDGGFPHTSSQGD